MIVFFGCTGNVSISIEDLPESIDPNISSAELDQTNFDCNQLGANLVTLTTIDNESNQSTCTFVVTVIDNIDPSISCQDITIQLNDLGNASIVPPDIEASSTDNCFSPILTLSKNNFDCSDVGVNEITLTATDQSGNSASCVSIVTVEDNMYPSVVCQDIDLDTDVNGTATITAFDVDNGSSDPCGIGSMFITNTVINCAGNTDVTLTVIDVHGNASSCISTVTSYDNIPPVITVNTWYNPEYSGNINDWPCGVGLFESTTITTDDLIDDITDGCGIADITIQPSEFSISDIGSRSITVTVTDNSGNSTSTTIDIIVVHDTTPPVAICQDITKELDAT